MRWKQRLGIVVTTGGLVVAAGLAVWPNADEESPAPIVMALSAGMVDDTTLSPIGVMRLHTAGRLAHGYRATLVTSQIAPASLTAQRRVVRDTLLPWVVLDSTRSTREEAVALRRRWPSAHRVVVVTTALHTRRACAAFRATGLTVTCIAAGWEVPYYALPYRLAYELLAFAKYRHRGWVH